MLEVPCFSLLLDIAQLECFWCTLKYNKEFFRLWQLKQFVTSHCCTSSGTFSVHKTMAKGDLTVDTLS